MNVDMRQMKDTMMKGKQVVDDRRAKYQRHRLKAPTFGCIVSKSWKLLKTGDWPLKYFLQRLFGTTHKDNLVLVPLDPRCMAACWGDPNELDQWRARSIGVSSLAEAESELHVLAHARSNFSLENIFRPLHLLCRRIASWAPIWPLQGSRSSDMRFLLRLLMLQRDVTFRLARRGPVAFCWAWDAGWAQLLWHVGKCKSLDQSVMTFEFPSWHVHLHLNRIWCFSGCTGWFFLGGAAGAQSCLHRALWGPWTQGPCSTIGLH